MAKKSPPKRPIQAVTDERTCSTCANSYDWHHPALDGHMTLGRCPHYTNGKFCVIASERACEHYKPQKQQTS